jgi:FixJ family two-component response regulator
MPNTNPISLMADEMLESFADVARTALRVRSMSRERLVVHVLGLLSEKEQQVWATVVSAAVDKAIRDMLPVNQRQRFSMTA